MTKDQTNIIFDLTYWKFETELGAAKLDLITRWVAAEKEVKLWQKFIGKKSETQVAIAITVAAVATAVS